MGRIVIFTRVFLASYVKDALLRYRKPILALTLVRRVLMWVLKDRELSSQKPRYLYVSMNSSSDLSKQVIFVGEVISGRKRLKITHLVFCVFTVGDRGRHVGRSRNSPARWQGQWSSRDQTCIG